MMFRSFFITLFTLSIGSTISKAQLFNPDSLRLISDQFSFTEGPAVNKKGEVFFTDQPNDKIWKYGLDGKLSIFMDKSGRANGLHFDRSGNLLVCADEQNQLWSIDKNGKIKVLIKDLDGKQLNGPNDLWVDKKGGIYFTDPYYQRDYWTRKQPELEKQNVYYLPAGKKKQLTLALDDLKQPNGIVGTPDGKYLYVSDLGARKTYRYEIMAEGKLGNKKLMFEKGSDGMTLDEEGNIYITGNGVTVFNKEGLQLAHVPLKGWTGNVCFVGKDRKQLFITSGKTIYIVPMRVRGVE
ncbi:SMP-30/gluconolactonase/LRE family protein [Pedobacter frigoris]|uniref:SMP-30/gluconolactonase/LRE family protein n=1 Tax=Pedobacter frigoris TaxID=2571272 RepID=A0A4U1CET4_9SPHI|nr:SMP-30/gluconolactonase/LRE family protein [Pedobacter frigoris]TKC03951.1 SMP-30/gluconolactonase/LRE family protein [Pedobacter frigoris]